MQVDIEAQNQTPYMEIKSLAARFQETLNHILRTKQKSWITKCAEFWQELAFWKKVVLGVGLGASLLIPGIMTKIAALVVGGFAAVSIYSAIAILLEQHMEIEVKTNDDITTACNPLINSLEITLESLNQLQNNFNDQINTLKINVDNLNTENLSLREIVQKMESLNLVKQQLEKDVDCLRVMNEALQNTITELSKFIISDQAQKEEFIERLNNFLLDKDASFDSIATRICEAEKELEIVKDELDRNNQKYTDLLKTHESLIERQESLVYLQSRVGMFSKANNEEVKEDDSNIILKVHP